MKKMRTINIEIANWVSDEQNIEQIYVFDLLLTAAIIFNYLQANKTG